MELKIRSAETEKMKNEKWKMANGKCFVLPPAPANCLLPSLGIDEAI